MLRHMQIVVHLLRLVDQKQTLCNNLPTSYGFQGGASFADHLCYFCRVSLCFRARLFIDTLWSPAEKGLTSWLSFVMSNCEVVTFPWYPGSGVVLDFIDS